MSPFDPKNARIGHVTRVIAGLGVCVPKKSVYSRGVVMMSRWVAALMKDGNVRCGSRSKSSDLKIFAEHHDGQPDTGQQV